MTITVYCGSSSGNDFIFMERAHEFGSMAARRAIRLVYGGGRAGLMGAVADGALEAGGQVVGVIPQSMVDRELAHAGLTELHVVPDMHVRKATMADLADAFVALPGGAGTMDELCEIWCWAQLGLHRKPIGLYDIEGYFEAWMQFVGTMVERGFLGSEMRNLLRVERNAQALLGALGT